METAGDRHNDGYRSERAYSVDVNGPLENWELDVRGYVTDGRDRVDFTIATSLQQFAAREATIAATFKVSAEGFEVSARLTGTPGDVRGDGEIDLTVRSHTDEVTVDAATVEGELDAEFRVNGRLLARATGDPRDPVIRGEGGRALTLGELRALDAIVDMAGDVFRLVGEVLEPAGYLLLVAFGLGD